MNQYNVYPGVGFFEAIKLGFKKYVNFRDRSRRSEYWFFILFNGIIFSLLIILMISTLKEVKGSTYSYYYKYYEVHPLVNALEIIYFLIMFLPIICIQIRRLHDIGKSGFFLFLHFIPLVGSIILLVFFCEDSEPGQNLYGPSPKYYTNQGTPINNSYNLSPIAPNQSSNEVDLNSNPQQDTYLQPQENMINPQTNQ